MRKLFKFILNIPGKIKYARYQRRITHLKLGKTTVENDKLVVKNIDKHILWQTRNILAVIIRDYLRAYAEQTHIIGNCVFEKDENGKYIYTGDNAEKYKEWKERLYNTASLFDNLTEKLEELSPEEIYSQENINAAFDSLKGIFNDLID